MRYSRYSHKRDEINPISHQTGRRVGLKEGDDNRIAKYRNQSVAHTYLQR